MKTTEENINCHNETAVDKLRNQLSPHYGLPEMILAIENHPEKKDGLMKLIIEQGKQAQANKQRIDELLIEIENPTKIYEALYNSSTEESSFATISIHRTKAGSEKAILDHKKKIKDEFDENVKIHG